jgi:uncharacterized membrane-anchored protein
MAKKFSWDSEELLGVHTESDKKQYEVKVCTLRNKEYVSVAEQQLVEDEWKYKNNKVIPMDVFKATVAFLDNY